METDTLGLETDNFCMVLLFIPRERQNICQDFNSRGGIYEEDGEERRTELKREGGDGRKVCWWSTWPKGLKVKHCLPLSL